jgi:hypothetical protein
MSALFRYKDMTHKKKKSGIIKKLMACGWLSMIVECSKKTISDNKTLRGLKKC